MTQNKIYLELLKLVKIIIIEETEFFFCIVIPKAVAQFRDKHPDIYKRYHHIFKEIKLYPRTMMAMCGLTAKFLQMGGRDDMGCAWKVLGCDIPTEMEYKRKALDQTIQSLQKLVDNETRP